MDRTLPDRRRILSPEALEKDCRIEPHTNEYNYQFKPIGVPYATVYPSSPDGEINEIPRALQVPGSAGFPPTTGGQRAVFTVFFLVYTSEANKRISRREIIVAKTATTGTYDYTYIYIYI